MSFGVLHRIFFSFSITPSAQAGSIPVPSAPEDSQQSQFGFSMNILIPWLQLELFPALALRAEPLVGGQALESGNSTILMKFLCLSGPSNTNLSLL